MPKVRFQPSLSTSYVSRPLSVTVSNRPIPGMTQVVGALYWAELLEQ